jgi:small ubiquitin-related modifier
MLKVKLETHDIWPEFDRLFSKDHFKFHTTFAYLCLKRVYKAIDFDCLSEYPKELQQEYARFICLKVLSNDVMELPPILSPSYRVDQVWHTHMLNPVAYVKMCYLLYPEEKIVIAHSQTPRVDISRYKNTLAIYKNTFLIDVDEIIWGNEDKQQYSSRVALIERERQKHRVSMGSTKEPKKHALLNHTESIIKKTKLNEATHIVLRVSNGTKTLGFKISRTNPFSTLLKSFCDQTGNSIDEVKFRIDGKPIMDHDTAEGLDLEDGDVIEATTPLKTVEWRYY